MISLCKLDNIFQLKNYSYSAFSITYSCLNINTNLLIHVCISLNYRYMYTVILQLLV